MAHYHSHRQPALYRHAHHTLHPMSRRVRGFVIYGSAALWLSGVLWMMLHYFFKLQTELGDMPSAWEPLVIRIHGIIALLVVFMLGWVSGTHVSVRWRQWRSNINGLILLSTAAVLISTGYALYYLVDDSAHRHASIVHQLFGMAAIVVALLHWFKFSDRRSD